jgi:signal transduction histidine kinase
LDKVGAKWTQMLKLGIAGGVEARVRRFDGEYRCFLIRGMPLLDESGSVTKWYGTSTDIEDLKRAEDKLRRSEAFLAQAQRLTKTGSLWWRVATGQIVWSEESYRLLDYTISITPTVDLIMQRCHPDDLQLVRRMVARSALEGTDMDFEHRLLMPDKSIKHIHVLVQYVGLHSGKPEFIGAVTDITERKRAEEELRKAQVELAHVTRVTTMGELAASIAHEVSQPISGVIINATTSLRWLKGLPADFPDLCRAREAIERAIRDGRRAGDIVSRIRQIFKKAETLKEPLDLNEAVRDVLILTRSELEKRRVALVLELSDRLPEVIGDRVPLQQVMLNLILNAIEAMSTVDEQRRQLIVRTQIHERTKILVTVRDTGPGLDSESMEKVFVAFHTTKPSGLGMGLSISRSIIENHSGRLWVTPNGGPGACFEFALPAYLGPTNSEHRT